MSNTLAHRPWWVEVAESENEAHEMPFHNSEWHEHVKHFSDTETRTTVKWLSNKFTRQAERRMLGKILRDPALYDGWADSHSDSKHSADGWW